MSKFWTDHSKHFFYCWAVDIILRLEWWFKHCKHEFSKHAKSFDTQMMTQVNEQSVISWTSSLNQVKWSVNVCPCYVKKGLFLITEQSVNLDISKHSVVITTCCRTEEVMWHSDDWWVFFVYSVTTWVWVEEDWALMWRTDLSHPQTWDLVVRQCWNARLRVSSCRRGNGASVFNLIFETWRSSSY